MTMKRVLILAAAAAGCATPYDPAPTASTAHFDVAGDDGGTLREAEAAWALFEEALGVSPARAKLVVVRDQEEFDRVAGDAVGAQGVYVRGRILTFPQDDARVIRHEVAHHFAVALVGELAPALNEGIAEVLEGITRVDGRAHVPIVSAEHLDRLLSSGVVEVKAEASQRHAHMDYAGAWALVAFALERETGTLAERLKAVAAKAPSLPTAGEVFAAAKRWAPELARILRDGVLDERTAAARVLGRLGEAATLRGAFESERFPRVKIAIAGALARTGDGSALDEVRDWVGCPHGRQELKLALGE
jgi:hypothetical protein